MNDSRGLIAGVAFIALIIIGSVYIQMGVWNECRDSGRSFFYCLNLIRR